jgi:hypothetical protein
VSSVVTLQPAAVVFREEQYFDWRVYALAAAFSALTGLALLRGRIGSIDYALGLFLGLLFVMVVITFVLHMTTEASPSEIRIWFGWAPGRVRVVPIGNVRSVEVVSYRPIADYGFWGVRAGRDGEKAYIARGNRGVRIELKDGSRYLIGSQRPDALATAIDAAARPGV